MGYKAKTLVRIEDANIRHRTFNKLVRMGYEMGLSDPYGIHPYILMDKNTVNIRARNIVDNGYSDKPPIRSEGFLDCNAYTLNGTEEEAVRLFLELAKMDDSESSGIWVERSVIQLWEHGINKTIILKESEARHSDTILSPLEVAEAFKEGRIEL